MQWITSPEAWIALATLTALEIVLGIDNIIFIVILVSRLPPHQMQRARIIGLAVAMVGRIALLLSLNWVMSLTAPLFAVFGEEISGRDLILIGGGVFLFFKSTHEIHKTMEVPEAGKVSPRRLGFYAVLIQIMVLDLVFSLDSVITAVGMARHLGVMILAIVIAVGIMMAAAKPIGEFVADHPTLKMLALSFLILIGVTLVAEGMAFHIPKGYIYFSMAFSVFVELLNMKLRKRQTAAAK